MGTFMWAPNELKWEAIGKYDLRVGKYRNFVWLTGENEVAHCLTMETARELGEWLMENTDAKQVKSTTEDDASDRARRFTEGWQRTIEEGSKGVRSR